MSAAGWPLAVIVGPTASGKSAAALRLCEAAAVEIVSCDSLQVYQGLDIGSAKPSALERSRVRHHLLDVVLPHEDFSAARYAELARAALGEIRGRGCLPLVVGGSGLYLRALLYGLFAGPARDAALRRRLERLAERRGDERLHALLARVDPSAAARIHPRDRLRCVRALEVYRLTRRRLSAHFEEPTAPLEGFEVALFGLRPERAELRARVKQRAADMFREGLVEEARAALRGSPGAVPRPLRAIGYRQALDVLAGTSSLATAQERLVIETMQYAKRQMTWFRHQAKVGWYPGPEPLIQAVREFWARSGDHPRAPSA